MPVDRSLFGDDPLAVAALARGIVDGDTERRRRAQLRPAEVYARYLWWKAGAHGHYPGCPCRPHHRLTDDTDELQP